MLLVVSPELNDTQEIDVTENRVREKRETHPKVVTECKTWECQQTKNGGQLLRMQ